MQALEIVIQELDRRVETLKEHLATGSVPDWADYQRIRGQVSGLLTAKLELQALAKNQEDADE